MKKNIVISIIILLYTIVSFYLMLPPINLQSPTFYGFILNIGFMSMLFINIGNLKSLEFMNKKYVKLEDLNLSKRIMTFNKIMLITLVSIFVLILCTNFIFSPLFMSSKYHERINIVEKNFAENIGEVDFSKLPLVDKESSIKLGDRTMGEMSSWVSQFVVSNEYSQINYNDEILRVTPLEYDGIIKYFSNKKNGIKGYITVNSVDGTSNLVTIDNGMKYMPSAYFSEDLYRSLRFKYFTKVFGNAVFEIDEEGNPYWIVPTLKYSAVGLLEDVEGVVVLNAVTGESKYYSAKDVPSWVDEVYTSDLIIEQIDDWGNYVNGFLNSVFTQKNVVNTTDGYNYLIIDEDVYLYTGITSVLADESNLGFMLVNLRTKEAIYYPIAGAEEFSAMASAEGLVQEKGYTASFPLLINLGGRATYMLSLKDTSGLVKMYAFVDVVNYQIVSVTESSYGIKKASEEYLSKMDLEVSSSSLKESTIKVKELFSANINGNTVYYIIDENNQKYSANINVDSSNLPFLKVGDTLSIKYTEKNINEIIEIIK